MGITVLPNYGAQAGANFAQLGQALAQIINPHLEFQKALKQAVATQPELGRELARLERDNPGILEKLGAGKIGEQIKTTVPSFSELVQRDAVSGYTSLSEDERRRFATSRMFGMTPIQMAVEGAVAPRVGEVVREQPELARRGAEVAVSGQTRGQRAEEDMGLILYGGATSYISKLNLSQREKISARAKIPGIFDEEDMLLRFQREKALFDSRTATDFQERLLAMQQADAARWASQTGEGTPTEWQTYLYGDRATLKPAVLTKLEKAQGALSIERKSIEYAGITNRIALTIDRINEQGRFGKTSQHSKVKMSDEARPLFLQQLQRDINAAASLGGPRLTVNYGKVEATHPYARLLARVGIEGGARLYFTDAQGEIVEPSTAVTLIQNPEVAVPEDSTANDQTEAVRARAQELQAQGKSRNEILVTLKREFPGVKIQ